MLHRLQLYFRRLGMFHAVINLLMLAQLLLRYRELWRHGFGWVCAGLFAAGLVAALLYRPILYRHLEQAPAVLNGAMVFVVALYGLQVYAAIRVPLWLNLLSHVATWFYWIAGFFYLSYDPMRDAPRLPQDMNQERPTSVPVASDDDNYYRRTV